MTSPFDEIIKNIKSLNPNDIINCSVTPCEACRYKDDILEVCQINDKLYELLRLWRIK